MRRRFFNAADNFVGGCYNKLSNEDIKRLEGIWDPSLYKSVL